MKAVYFEKGSYRIIETDKPMPTGNEAMVRVRSAGICNTDIELHRGYYGFTGVPGHEFVGEVESCPVAPNLEGRRVVADINIPVGDFDGDPRHVHGRDVLGIVNRQGAFAEYVCIPVTNLYPVPENVPDRAAVFAEPLAAGLEPGQQLHIHANDRVLVLGDGKLGLLTALGLRIACPGIVLAGRHESKLGIAARQGVETLRIDKPDELAGIADGMPRFDTVIEATGSEHGLGYAMNFVRPEGTIVVKTTSHNPSSIDLAKIVVDEISIVGSRCGDISYALSVLERNMMNVRPMIEAEYDFADFEKAFEHSMEKGTLKILLNMK